MYWSIPYYYSHFVSFYLDSVGIVVCPVCRGVLRTPRLLYITILCDVPFNSA